MKTIVPAIAVFALSLAFSNTARAAQAPLSCLVEMMVIGVTAMQRDEGVKREATSLSKNKDGEFTAKEIKFILDLVYIHGKGKTPDQIKNAQAKRCESGRR